jgi:hypothetical protein
MGSRISTKILNEFNMYKSTIGAINTEPVFVSFTRKLAGDFSDMLNGEKTVTQLLARNVGAAEMFK